MEEQNLTTTKKKKWLLPAIISIIVVAAAISVIAIYNLPANRRDRQLALAEKYMSELNYEAAILAYKAAIEIDPKCEDAYLELLDLYIATEAYDKAEEVIAQAENNLDDEIILAMREKTNTLLASADTEKDNKNENTNREENATTTEATTESEPYLRYMQTTSYDSEGNITSIKKEEYDTDGNIINTTLYNADGTAYYSEECQYDNNDNLIMSARYDKNKNLTSKTEYDSNGNQLSTISYDENGDIEQHTENTYDENGNRIKFVSYFSDGSIESQNEYNANGIIIESVSYNNDGSVKFHETTHEYKEDGTIHILNWSTNSDNNNPSVEYEYIYDNNWNILREIDLTGESKNEYIYEYNDEKLITEIHDLDNGYFIDKIEYEYYNDGNLQSSMYYSSYNGEPFSLENYTLYAYDQFGNHTEEVYNYDGTLSSLHEYDNNGNETKYQSYINGELTQNYITEYDAYGNVIYYNTSDTSYTYNYEYDSDGNIITYQVYGDNGDGQYLIDEYKYEFDEYGKEISYSYSLGRSESIYDENENLIKKIWYDFNNVISGWTEYEYIYE